MGLFQSAESEETGLRFGAVGGEVLFELGEGGCQGEVGVEEGWEEVLGVGDAGVGCGGVGEEGGLEGGIVQEAVEVGGSMIQID